MLNVQVPRAFDAVLRRAMAKRPDERYQSAAEFKQAIVAASSAHRRSRPAGVERDRSKRRRRSWSRRRHAAIRSARSRAWRLGLPLAALCLGRRRSGGVLLDRPAPRPSGHHGCCSRRAIRPQRCRTALATAARCERRAAAGGGCPPDGDGRHQRRGTRRSRPIRDPRTRPRRSNAGVGEMRVVN